MQKISVKLTKRAQKNIELIISASYLIQNSSDALTAVVETAIRERYELPEGRLEGEGDLVYFYVHPDLWREWRRYIAGKVINTCVNYAIEEYIKQTKIN